MTAKQITVDDFARLFSEQPCVYDSPAFCILNSSKVQDVKAVAIFEGDVALASQIFGLRDGLWRAPFSAPYSAPSLKAQIDIDQFYSLAVNELGDIKLALPPMAYCPVAVPTIGSRLNEANFHYPMERFAEFEAFLSRSGRYSHHRALRHPFRFCRTDDIPRAYALISENRRAMGYPLAMSLEQVEETVKIIPADFFILTLDGLDLAAAMVYRVSPGVAQVIYWGDLPEARQYRAMNHLAYRVIQWYAENAPEISILDIGPASTDGVRNEGLCQFKLSIGCVETPKPIISLHAGC